MKRVDTVVIGGGQAGLAVSRSLTERHSSHVVLERGRIGERWRSERWDSLRLLTPRWQARLPGWSYNGSDPDGYMTRDELVSYLEEYASSFDAPVRTGVTVERVSARGGGFDVVTDQGAWHTRNVVVATGDCQTPLVPDFARDLPGGVYQVGPTRYRNPESLPDGGVLVVGASATGLQLAAEIHSSGRPVTLAVGRHTRLPRTYRGRDIMAWLDEMGVLDERAEDVRDLEASRSQPSLQLVGTPGRSTLDLSVAQRLGIRLVGRARSVAGHVVHFGDNLVEDAAAADFKMIGLLRRIDEYIDGLSNRRAFPTEPFPSLTGVSDGPASMDLASAGIRTVLWATGFRRSYPWLHLPVLDQRGEIRHDRGITPHAGLYVVGLRFLRRRNSSFLDGQRNDAEEIADHILSRRPCAAVA